ncbi:MAG: dipeptide/oligopeptide/nickel ABC transporter ATP-binding protein [Maledivibacter sp.]|jgi:peptide/nickel transport system ATP-binding protein|nr:dipeptide/oligopeptide/nickel ABC transporter ATP-binding protein [Maledivibacter sp.]
MLDITHLFKSYEDNPVLKDVSFHLKNKRSIAIVGESGSGKSTIANILLGFEAWNEGDISYKGKSLKFFDKKDWKDYRKDIQPVFQDSHNSLNPRMKVKDLLSEPLRNFTTLRKNQRYKRVEEILSIVDLNPRDGEKYPHTFSTGQQKRINIARAIICDPKMIVLDEGTSGLDPETKNNMIRLIQRLQTSQNITFIMITHDISIAQRLASHIVILKEGMVIEDVEEFEDMYQLKSGYAKQLIDAVPKLKYIGGLK